jgi:hypothetical protein
MIVRDAAALLGAGAELRVFQRGHMLVSVAHAVRRDDTGAKMQVPRFQELKEGGLRVKLAAVARWERWDARAKRNVACLPPEPVIGGLLQADEWIGVPDAQGLVAAPIIRSDGTIRAEPGFDDISGLYLLPTPSSCRRFLLCQRALMRRPR